MSGRRSCSEITGTRYRPRYGNHQGEALRCAPYKFKSGSHGSVLIPADRRPAVANQSPEPIHVRHGGGTLCPPSYRWLLVNQGFVPMVDAPPGPTTRSGANGDFPKRHGRRPCGGIGRGLVVSRRLRSWRRVRLLVSGCRIPPPRIGAERAERLGWTVPTARPRPMPR